MTGSARLCQHRSKRSPDVAVETRLPRARPSQGHRVRPLRTRGACSAWIDPRSCSAPTEALREEPRQKVSLVPFETVWTEMSDIEVGPRRLDDVSTVSTDQHAYYEPPESRPTHGPDSSGPKPTFAETARRPAGPTTNRRTNRNLSATDRTRPKSCPDWRPTSGDVATTELAHVYRTSLGTARTTRHPSIFGFPRPSRELRNHATPRGGIPPKSASSGHSLDHGMPCVRIG